MFQIKVVEKIKTHFMFSNFFSENCAMSDVRSVMEEDRPQTILRLRMAYCIGKVTRVQAHTHTHAPTPTDTYECPHLHSHMHTRAHTHTQTHTNM